MDIETISNFTIYFLFLEITLEWEFLSKALRAHVQVFL